MTPTIGRVVIYSFVSKAEADVASNGAAEVPAVIVRVWSDTCVNLKVLTDGTYDLWKTSVSLGDLPGQWRWPVKV